MDLTPALGAVGSAELTVTAADTADAVGSGDVAVLATPRLLALAEAATVDALRPLLTPEQSTVGVHVELSHRAATPVGGTATATATLVSVDGRTVRFEVVVRDDLGSTAEPRVVGGATIERAVVDRERFLAKLPTVPPTPSRP